MTVAPSAQPAHRGFHWRIWFAEAVGTALFVLGALSSAALILGRGSPLEGAVPTESLQFLVVGLLVGAWVGALVVSPLGRLSGAHLNPAVTLAFSLLGRVSLHDVVGYVIAQLVGAIAGAAVFGLAWGSIADSVGGGVTHPTIETPLAVGLELAMTAILLAMILLFVSRERLIRWVPLMLWPLLGLLIWQEGPYTGTSLNPARSLGPAVASSDFGDLWLYFVAPAAGALLTAVLWRKGDPSRMPKTAKLFHDARYPCPFASDLPAMPVGAPTPKRPKTVRSPGAVG